MIQQAHNSKLSHLIIKRPLSTSTNSGFFTQRKIIQETSLHSILSNKRIFRKISMCERGSSVGKFHAFCSDNIFKKKDQKYLPTYSYKKDKEQLRETDDTIHETEQNTNQHFVKIHDFKKLKMMGRGKHGIVYLAVHLKTGFLGAMKVIKKIDFLLDEEKDTEKMRKQLIRELSIQHKLNNGNIIKLYSIFDDKTNIYLFMELGSGGQLYELSQKKKKFSQDAISFLSKSILGALSYMHENNYIHRDLKPENIVLIHGLPKICDFGESASCKKQIGQLRDTLCGTPLYLSPEILRGQKYNQKIDIWAAGSLAYELLTGENPFKIKTKEQMSKIVTDSFQMKEGSAEFRNFIELCLKKNPLERPSAKCLLEHAFIKKYEELQTCQQFCNDDKN